MQVKLAVVWHLAAAAMAAPRDIVSRGGGSSPDLPAAASAWDNFTVVPVTWDVKATPRGETLRLEGTAQEVYRRLVEMNPAYDDDFAGSEYDSGDGDGDGAGRRHLERRTDFSTSNFICSDKKEPYGPFGRASSTSYWEALGYLAGLKGAPTLSAGPRVCGRVSCSYNGAVYVCNDTPAPKTLKEWGSVRDGLVAIHGKCSMMYPAWMMGGAGLSPDELERHLSKRELLRATSILRM
ncbi:hypothetical protein JDV02_009699 [Purpureocillium takamizusanense]|uniref:Uncharacterized protein n=1 Tax=Purpureocillium takamizusanense TaxID=2060973 RepID=A0A9Q8QR62_9HYPO|nr:uncharacterized protein JDV02_009699 [Purpureocillium takamizusanense]UNI23907.1 hypothetical protein JDV02_009699 [Purpureocillium takamizusanense]